MCIIDRASDHEIFKMTMNSAQCLFRELPYYGIEFIEHHGQFNNSLNNNLTTKKQLQRLNSLHDLDVFSLNINTFVNPDHNLNYKPIQCNYYSPYGFSQFSQQKSFFSSGSSFSLLHNNVRQFSISTFGRITATF